MHYYSKFKPLTPSLIAEAATMSVGDTRTFWIFSDRESRLSQKYPGQYSLQHYDPAFLLVHSVTWYPCNGGEGSEAYPSLAVCVEALQQGKTKLVGIIQEDAFNPLFIEWSCTVNIIASGQPKAGEKALSSSKTSPVPNCEAP